MSKICGLKKRQYQTFTIPFRCLSRNYPQNLPTVSVVIIYLNEALSIIQRAIRSIINRTPKLLLKEIILVDDCSTYSKF